MYTNEQLKSFIRAKHDQQFDHISMLYRILCVFAKEHNINSPFGITADFEGNVYVETYHTSASKSERHLFAVGWDMSYSLGMLNLAASLSKTDYRSKYSVQLVSDGSARMFLGYDQEPHWQLLNLPVEVISEYTVKTTDGTNEIYYTRWSD